MTRTTISVHIGAWPDRPHADEPRDGARISVHYPNTMDPLVILVVRDGDDWLVRWEHPDPTPLARAISFIDALDSALAYVSGDIQSWH